MYTCTSDMHLLSMMFLSLAAQIFDGIFVGVFMGVFIGDVGLGIGSSFLSLS